jgi:fatty acid amide hydrolase 2
MLLTQSALSLAADIKAKKISSRAVVEAHIAQIKCVNPRLNAVVFDRFAEALREADAADALIANTTDPESLPPLLGVPCTIKDTFEFTGMPQVVGMVSRRDVYGQKDSYAVAALRTAGAIPLGVTNTPELAMWYETYNRVYGRSKNAYDRGRITGGSSGGEGAIVGAGGTPFGLGSDVAGSIRMPAFFNGVFGHKASPMLINNDGHFPSAHGQTLNYLSAGPLCRRAEDLEVLVRILAGENSAKLKSVKDVDISKLRVITISPERGPKATFDILDAQQKAVDALVKQGAIHVTVDLPLIDDAFMIWSSLLADSSSPEHSFTAMMFGEYHIKHPLKALATMAVKGKKSPHTLPLLVLTLLEQFPNVATGQRQRFVDLGHQLKQQLNTILGDDGVLVMPTFPEVAPRHGMPIFKPFDFVDCAIVNAMELPSTAVPMGLNAGGIPTGIQVVSNQNNDHLSIACAVALERATGGWIPPWRSWLAELPETTVIAQLVQEPTKAVKKTVTRKKAKLD